MDFFEDLEMKNQHKVENNFAVIVLMGILIVELLRDVFEEIYS